MRWRMLFIAMSFILLSIATPARAETIVPARAETIVPARAETIVQVPGGLAPAMEDIAAAARAATLDIRLVEGHSPAQARQIVEGSPADIFVSADPQWMDFLAARHLLAEGTRADVATTHLVVIAAAGSSFAYSGRPGDSLAEALAGGRLAIGDPDTLPAGRFARAALQRIGAWDAVAGHLAPLPNVRTVVAMVERGEVPAGIGFASDLGHPATVRVVATFPPDIAPPIHFPIAVIAGHQTDSAMQVYNFILGPQAAAILRAHGFDPPASAPPP